MPKSPPAEIDIDSSLVAALLADQFPEAGQLPVRPFARGWDNVLYSLGPDLLVRMPRRAVAASLVRNETTWLPRLMPYGDYTPRVVLAGDPGHGYPWPWAIMSFVHGATVTDLPVPARGALAEGLARALTLLHTPAPADAPHNPVRGHPLHEPGFQGRVRARIQAHERATDLEARWDAWSSAPAFSGPPQWVHGDLHPHNLIATSMKTLAAVVDWGDLTAGDPATDLATAWLTFDRAGRRIFRSGLAATHPDPEAWLRARAWALHLGLILEANNDDLPALAAVGTHAISSLLEEDPLATEA